MSALPVLMYHHVTPNPGLVTVAPETFRAHISWLTRNGWHSIGASEIEAFFQGRPLPKKSVAITFDDGYLDNFVHAHPVLEEFGLKAMLFVVTGWIGNGTARSGDVDCPDHRECKKRIAAGESDSVMLRWSEIELMQQAGTFEFHSHTHTHTRWDKQLPDRTKRNAALVEDLRRSRTSLNERLGQSSRHLCWPQGYYDADYVGIAQQAGFDHLYTTAKRPNLANSDPLHIGRIVVKDAPAAWLAKRLFIYRSALLSKAYLKLKGEKAFQS
jgi:peptidoglycan/xylan/chitin deacetylase (PgdA/CDA1 family)